MPRRDRTAVRFALIALAMRCKTGPLADEDFAQAERLVEPLEPDDLLRLGLEKVRAGWGTKRRDGLEMYHLGAELARVTERDNWPASDTRIPDSRFVD